MTALDFATGVLLAVAVGAAVLSTIGVLVAHDYNERIHYLSPVASIGIVSVAVAVLLRESFNQAGIKVLLIAAAAFLTNSAMSHATARAGYTRQQAQRKRQAEREQKGADRVRSARG